MRPALARRIADSLDGGSIVLVAPAGYGKTEAIREAVTGSGRPVAWLRCLETDREPGHLLSSLIETLAPLAPGIAERARERLLTSMGPSDPLARLRSVRSELDRLLVEPAVLVVDDCERLGGHGDAERLLAELIAADPGRIPTVLASRRPLPLRAARAQAAGTLAELGPADLAFEAAECASLLEAARGRRVDSDEVAATMAETDGWPLGIALAAHGVGPGIGPDSRARIDTYLQEEVLDPLDAEIRAATLAASLPEQLDAQLVTALDLPAGLDAQLTRRGLPIVAGTAPHSWSYHPLLRELLRARLADELPAAERELLHGRLAAELSRRDQHDEAIPHWLAADRPAEALELLRAVGPRLVRTSPDVLREWLAKIAEQSSGELPPLADLLAGQLAQGAGSFEEAKGRLRRAIAGYAAGGDRPGEWGARFLLQEVGISLGDLELVDELAEGWDEAAESGAAGFLPLAVALWSIVPAIEDGRLAEARELADRLEAHPAAAPMLPVHGLLLGFLDVPAGRGDEAIARVRAAIGELDKLDPLGMRAITTGGLAEQLTEQGHTGEAIEWWLRAAAAADELGQTAYVGSIARAAAAVLLGRHRRLEEADRELALAGEPILPGWRRFYFDLARASIADARGESPTASRAARAALTKVASGLTTHRLWAALAAAPILVRAGDVASANAAVADALGIVDRSLPGSSGRFYRARLLATRAWLSGRADARPGSDDLSAAWREAGSNASHLIRGHWEQIQPLLAEALADGVLPAAETLTAIEAAFPGEARSAYLTDHPLPEVRRAAVEPALRSGNPEAIAQLDVLQADPDAAVSEAARRAAARLRRDPPPLRFQLLGGFAAKRGLWEIDASAWRRPMAARLVRFLLVHGGSRVPEDDLFEAFWPGRAPDSARRALQVVTSEARNALDIPGAEHSTVEVHERTYRLRLREADEVDAGRFEAAALAAVAECGRGRLGAFERAVGLWGGEPAPEERYADWSVSWRTRLLDLYGEVLAGLVASYSEIGDQGAGLRAARQLVDLDPLNERAQRELIAAYARVGRRADALHQYLECRRSLVDELGIEPARETTELHASVLAGEPP